MMKTKIFKWFKWLTIVFHIIMFGGMAIKLYAQDTWQSKLVKFNEVTRELTYSEDPASGIRIPDFSCAGYKGGGVPLPELSVVETLSPISGDNTSHIQNAINRVSKLTPDQDGFRGAVLLNPGEYEVHGQIDIVTSGVVLRGSGRRENPDSNTILIGVGNVPLEKSIIRVGGLNQTKFGGKVAGTKTDIITNLVKVGDKKFRVANSAPYKAGDNIIVHHPCTEEWLAAIDYGGTASDEGWKVGSQRIMYNTRIEKINGDTIYTNSPVFNNLDRSLSQAYIYKYDRDGLVENSGVENLRINIKYVSWDSKNHAKNGILISQAENCWVTRCKILHFWRAGVELQTANYITVDNVHATDPKGPITGGYRYNFCASDAVQNSLFTNCRATKGRHNYASNGASSTAGVVFHNCESIDPYTACEAGHRRWTTGVLFDKLRDHGQRPSKVLGLYNRGDWGTGHGWSSANSVAWNCDATREGDDGVTIIHKPPTAQNFSIGSKGVVTNISTFTQPKGYTEGTNRTEELIPSSLYEAQLYWRLNGDQQTDITDGTGKQVNHENASLVSIRTIFNGNKIVAAVNLLKGEDIEIAIFNSKGQLVFKTFRKSVRSGKSELSISHSLSSGVYYIKTLNKNTINVSPLVIDK